MTDCEKFINMSQIELENFIKESEFKTIKLKEEFIKIYNVVQPQLIILRNLKKELNKQLTTIETAKTFLSIEKNGSLISSIDLEEIKKHIESEDENIKIPQKSSDIINEQKKQKFKSPLVANWINKKT